MPDKTPYVTCPVMVTSPAADEVGMTPNLVCGERVTIPRPARIMDCVCPRGHRFFAAEQDLKAR